jgi:hypothetical protein
MNVFKVFDLPCGLAAVNLMQGSLLLHSLADPVANHGEDVRYPFNFDKILLGCHDKIINTPLHNYMQIKHFIMA